MTTILQNRMRQLVERAKASEAKINEIFMDSFPMVLESTVSRMLSGENRQINFDESQNPYVNAFLVREIRFRLLTSKWRAYGSARANFGGLISVQFTAGRFALSRVPIPICMFGPPILSLEHDEIPFSTDVDETWDAEDRNLAGPELGTVFASRTHIGHFRWRLPRPLLLPPGAALDARVYRANDGFTRVPADIEQPTAADSPGIDVSIAYVGEVARAPLPPGLVVPIPYVGLYRQAFPSTGGSLVQSGQLDLSNPFDRPLNVQHFLGRLQSIFPYSSGAPNFGLPQAVMLDLGTAGGTQPAYFPPVSITRFDNANVTREIIPGVSVFEGYQRAFNMPIQLAPADGFTVQIDARTGLPFVNNSPQGSNTAFVSMVGWREEAL